MVKEIQLAGFNFVRCVRGNKVIFYFGERGPFFLTYIRDKNDFNTKEPLKYLNLLLKNPINEPLKVLYPLNDYI